MKNRKIRWTGAAAVVLTLALLSGCGTETDGTATQDLSAATENGGEKKTETKDTNEEAVAFEELTVVDNDACTVKLTEFDPDGAYGYTLTAYLENKTEDQTFMYSVTYGAINGLCSDPVWAEEVAPGKKSNSELSWPKSTLTDYGIDRPTDIELSFRVYDSDDWSADAVAEEIVHVYPYGEAQAEIFTREQGDSDVVLVENEQVKATVVGYEADEIWGYTVKVFLENKTDASAMFSVDEAAVNGYMIDPFWAASIPAGKCGFSDIQWAASSLEENGITEVEKIEFVLKAYNDEDYSANAYAEEQCTLQP